MSICIKNATIVNEGERTEGSVIVENGTITQVLKGNVDPDIKCDTVIDAQKHILMPGIIDDHVHFREPGLTDKADMASESAAAAAGGVTSFMDMPNCNPQTTTLEALEEKFETAAGKSIVNYSFYFGATDDNVGLFPRLDKSRVCGIKLFMGSSTGNMRVDEEDKLKRIFSGTDMLIAAHCEDSAIIQWNSDLAQMKYGDDPDICFHPIIRSEEACWKSSSLAVRMARETGVRLHVLHVSTERELELFEDKPLSEKRITAEACIPHLMFSDVDYTKLGARIKCNPSIKTESDRKALRNTLSHNRIDVIGTDHAPHLLSEKAGGALKAASGMPSIQFSLVCMMELVNQGILTVEQVVQKMCHAPAELFHIDRRGYIRPGYKADLVIVNPDKEWEVTPQCILSKCGWSPFEGKVFHSKIEKTLVNGCIVYSDGQGVDTAHRGEELRFDRQE